jgi:oligopeptide transport system ATP-binding protein
MTPVLEVEKLSKTFSVGRTILGRPKQRLHAVADVSFQIGEGETLGLVGESGSGKSTTARLVARLLDPDGGRVFFDGQDLLAMSRREVRRIRTQIQFVFQDPYASLDPTWTVGRIVTEPLRSQGGWSKQKLLTRALEVLDDVGLPREAIHRYPYEFSGGQRQRIAIARALSPRPRLIICDEPVSALDVSTQAQVVNLLQDLQEEYGVALLFIAHDINVVRHVSHRIAVMYFGRIVEYGLAEVVCEHPEHPYTRALMAAVPGTDPDARRRAVGVVGEPPSPLNPPPGCPFNSRCPEVEPRCLEADPALLPVVAGHLVACHRREAGDGGDPPGGNGGRSPSVSVAIGRSSHG